MIAIASELAEQALREFLTCGGGRRECVVYLVAEQTATAVVTAVVHPEHQATFDGYDVESVWITRFFLLLADKRRTAVGQAHTHPGQWVDHSAIDDEFVLVPSPGFVSVVVPEFGRDGDRSHWGILVLDASGEWRRDPSAVSW